jgi:hypothetical protein
MAWLLRDRLRLGDADDAQDRRPHPAAAARDHSAPLETPTNDPKRLVALGVNRRAAWHQVYQGRRSWWALSHAHAVDQGLRNAYFAKHGLTFVVDLHHQAHQHIAAPDPQQLALWG